MLEPVWMRVLVLYKYLEAVRADNILGTGFAHVVWKFLNNPILGRLYVIAKTWSAVVVDKGKNAHEKVAWAHDASDRFVNHTFQRSYGKSLHLFWIVRSQHLAVVLYQVVINRYLYAVQPCGHSVEHIVCPQRLLLSVNWILRPFSRLGQSFLVRFCQWHISISCVYRVRINFFSHCLTALRDSVGRPGCMSYYLNDFSFYEGVDLRLFRDIQEFSRCHGVLFQILPYSLRMQKSLQKLYHWPENETVGIYKLLHPHPDHLQCQIT